LRVRRLDATVGAIGAGGRRPRAGWDMTIEVGAARFAAAADGVGVLAGLARHGFPKAPVEVIERADVGLATGIAGDWRGAMKGRPYRRQVTLIARADWDAAMAEVGRNLAWWERRCNVLVDGLRLPQRPGARLRLGADVVLEVTRCTDPCERMEALAPGLFAALNRDWRGGVCTAVVAGGSLAIGDAIRIED
jgi:MOSC domain-containing protein YiiM